jgi:hypothetical protein
MRNYSTTSTPPCNKKTGVLRAGRSVKKIPGIMEGRSLDPLFPSAPVHPD